MAEGAVGGGGGSAISCGGRVGDVAVGAGGGGEGGDGDGVGGVIVGLGSFLVGVFSMLVVCDEGGDFGGEGVDVVD